MPTVKKLLLTIFAALLCITVQAGNILVYNKNVSTKTIGGGYEYKDVSAGWMILDVDNSKITLINLGFWNGRGLHGL
jgi:hypothetical protein